MARYALVENGQITELYLDIPTAWRNISGFHHLSDSERAELGFHSIRVEIPDHDPRLQRLVSNGIKVGTDNLPYTEYYVEDVRTEQEFNEQRYNEFITGLRVERNTLLYRSDWTQMLDIQSTKTQIWKDAWIEYRQQLRDLPESYQDHTQDYKMELVPWPIEPTGV